MRDVVLCYTVPVTEMDSPGASRQAPVRLCCMQRHYGAVCPDGKVMCCLCYGRFLPSELSETVDGDKQDVCVRCYEAERVTG